MILEKRQKVIELMVANQVAVPQELATKTNTSFEALKQKQPKSQNVID